MSRSAAPAFGDRAGGAFVVGGSGAVGGATAERLAAMGAHITVTYGGAAERAYALVDRLVERGCTARAARMDMGDAAQVRAVVEEAAKAHGGLHTVVLAASPTNHQSHVSRLDPARYVEQLTVDSGGTFRVISAALPALRESRGSIVVVSTVANRRFVVRDVLSSAPKAANEALVRAVAAEEGRFGVRANTVGVGILDEGMIEVLIDSGDIRPGDLELARTRIPLRCFGKARDVAAAVAFLASDDARYITGQWIDVDGGYGL